MGGEERSEMSGDEGEKAKGGGGGGKYGTFQGPPSYPPPRPPAVGYPQPVQPPGLFGQRYSRNRGGYHSGAGNFQILPSNLGFLGELKIPRQVYVGVVMIAFLAAGWALAGFYSYSVLSLVPFPGMSEHFCCVFTEGITGRNQDLLHAQ